MDRKHSNSKRKRNKNFSNRLAKIPNRVIPYPLKIEVTQDVVDGLLRIYNCGEEDCGVFTGSRTINGTYRICRLSPSCSQKYNASYSGCIRDAKMANDFIQEEFERSNHTRAYIGEWHSHPEDMPKPSVVDKLAIKKIYESVKSPFDIVLFAIIGWKKIYWGMYDGNRFSELEHINII